MEKEADATEGAEKKGGMHLPAWAVEWGRKLLPYLLIGIVTAGFKLYYDNISNIKDISRNTWWNQEQDKARERTDDRVSRLESRQDRSEETDAEFHSEMREKMDRLLRAYKR
jgi:hypothetical protein